MYRYRGEKLRQLNRWEYYSIVQVKKATKSDEEDEDVVGATSEESGRKKNKCFDFGKGIMIFGSYQQMLRSKQVTLKFFAHPPRHPGPSPLPDAHSTKTERWRNAANKFALYFLMLFRPEEDLYEEGQPNMYSYRWEDFINFAQYLKQSEKEVDKLRYEIMERVMHSWRTNSRHRILLSKYRERSCTI